jgi:hypothetical protein
MENINDIVWVTAAEALDNYLLRLIFNNGKVKIFDCKSLIAEMPAFHALNDEAVFRNISLDGWTVTWLNGTIDIAPEYLYEKGVVVYDESTTTPDLVAEDKAPYKAEKSKP